jgi:V/A-type H+-transporting ATPase subunit E
MEDVRTSEALEKEVLEEARKKAEKILKNAAKQIEDLRTQWRAKKESELAALDAETETRKALWKKEMEASFPLEMQRRKLRFMDGVFENFLRDFFKNLSGEELSRALAEKGKSFAAFFSAGKDPGLSVLYAGLSREQARAAASSVLGTAPAGLTEGEGFRGLVFCAPGGAYRCRLTAGEIENELREYHRKALMDALWGEASHAAV